MIREQLPLSWLRTKPMVLKGITGFAVLGRRSVRVAVLRHADALAVRLGEPFGTVLLTLAVIGIKVAMIAAVSLTGKDHPGLARDIMFSVVMIIVAGMPPPCC